MVGRVSDRPACSLTAPVRALKDTASLLLLCLESRGLDVSQFDCQTVFSISAGSPVVTGSTEC